MEQCVCRAVWQTPGCSCAFCLPVMACSGWEGVSPYAARGVTDLVCLGPPTPSDMSCDWKKISLICTHLPMRLLWLQTLTLLTTAMHLQHTWICSANLAQLCSGNLGWRDRNDRQVKKERLRPSVRRKRIRDRQKASSSSRVMDSKDICHTLSFLSKPGTRLEECPSERRTGPTLPQWGVLQVTWHLVCSQ